MFTYSHANTPLGQSERAYYLSYFIKHNMAMAHVMLYNIAHVMLCNMAHAMLYNMGRVVLCYITCVMLCYVMLCYIT